MSERVGYVLKVYPRFSETFVVTELLALEALGADLEVFSLRPPTEGRFHPVLAQVRSQVTYLSRLFKTDSSWLRLRAALEVLGEEAVTSALPDLVALPASDASQALELAVLVRERGITRLHAHFGSVATAVARVAALLAGVPYTFTAHAKDIFHEEVDAAALTQRARDAQFVVTVSEYNRRWLEAVHGPARVEVMNNGVDLARFTFDEPRSRPRRVVSVGRLVEKKGFDVLLEACALLRERGVEFECVLAGSGVLEEELRTQRSALGLEDLVSMPGPLPQTEVVDLVRSGAVFAAPCVVADTNDRDGLPTVIVESMALGTPVVSTPVTGIPEAVEDGVTGLLVPERDPAGLADALTRLLDDADERVSLAAAARSVVEERFDASRQALLLARLMGVVR